MSNLYWLPASPAYARVDGIARPGRGFVVSEVELIEPALFLHLCPAKADRVVDLLCPGRRGGSRRSRS